jgi:hypothetical protein
MTATTLDRPVPGGARRVLDVARIQGVNWQVHYLVPLAVLGMIFLVNLALFAMIVNAPTDRFETGALSSVYFVVAVAHLQTITQTFPFALGLGVTRRTFSAATVLVVTLQAVVYGTLLTLLAAVERATGGWGLGARFFEPFGLLDGLGPLARWAGYTVPFLALSMLFVLFGVVFARWGQPGVYVLTVGGGLLLALAAIVVTWQRWWPVIGAFFGGSSMLALLAGYPLVIAVVLGLVAFAALRRATP